MNRRKLILAGILAAVSVLGGTAVVQAHDGENHDTSTVSQGQVVNKTHFSSGRDVTMAGEVDGDMFCAGQNVTISGRVKGDVICAGQIIRITGTVDGDVRLAAQNVTIDGVVDGSLSAAAENVRLDGKAEVRRDVSVVATSLTTAAAIGRDLNVTANSVTVGGAVTRDVNAQVDSLTLGDAARVGGNVAYASNQDLQRDAGAEVSGRINRSDLAEHSSDSGGGMVFARIFSAATLLLTALFLVLLIPGVFHAAAERARGSLGMTVLTGFLVSIAAPVLIIALMLTVIGIPLALFLLLVWLVVLFLSGPFAAYLAGRLMLRGSTNAVLIMLAGAVVLVLLYQIPVINFLALLAVVWSGVGMIALSLWRLRRRPHYDMAPAGDAGMTPAAGADVAPEAGKTPAATVDGTRKASKPRSTRPEGK